MQRHLAIGEALLGFGKDAVIEQRNAVIDGDRKSVV